RWPGSRTSWRPDPARPRAGPALPGTSWNLSRRPGPLRGRVAPAMGSTGRERMAVRHDFDTFVGTRWARLVRAAVMLGCSEPDAEDAPQRASPFAPTPVVGRGADRGAAGVGRG